MQTASAPPDSVLIVPFAYASDPACHTALAGVALPHLSRLLAQWHLLHASPAQDELTWSPPHERAWGWALGWDDPGDGRWPWAAWQARRPDQPCAWFTPCHWQVGNGQVTLVPPDALALGLAQSQALMDALAPWAAEDGVQLILESPTRWRAEGEPLRHLASASLDRAAHRRADAWLPRTQDGPTAQWMLRLQNEAQMLFYQHPLHDERVSQGLLPINGFWTSASGAYASATTPATSTRHIHTHEGLRAAAWAGDWAAWAQAWAQLDQDIIGPWLASSAPRHLVLCGERGWCCWSHPATQTTPPQALSWWQRLWPRQRSAAPTPTAVLCTL